MTNFVHELMGNKFVIRFEEQNVENNALDI
jgi:hypothetical protein